MINTGVRGVINHHKSKKQEIYPNDLEYYQNIYFKMAATSDNCVFVNFHETDKNKLYGISDFFEKIVLFVERTDAYRKFQKDSCMNEVEFRIRIEEEAKIRKKRAAAIISRHKIGSAIAGLLPGVDYLANRFFIKKDAMRKAGQIFGFDIDELSNSIKYENDKNQKEMKNKGNNISNNESLMLKEENDKIPRPQASVIKENEEDKEKNELDNINKEKKKERDKKIKVSGYGAMYTCSAVSFGTSIPRILFAVGSVGLLAVSTVFSVVGCAVGAGVGYYLMKRHCEDILDQFELLFILLILPSFYLLVGIAFVSHAFLDTNHNHRFHHYHE